MQLQFHIKVNQQMFMEVQQQHTQLIQETSLILSRQLFQLILEASLHQRLNLKPLQLIQVGWTMFNQKLQEERQLKLHLEVSHTLRFILQFNKQLMLNRFYQHRQYRLTKPIDSRLKFKLLLLCLLRMRLNMNKKFKLLKPNLRRSIQAVCQLLLSKERKKLKREDVHHGCGS